MLIFLQAYKQRHRALDTRISSLIVQTRVLDGRHVRFQLCHQVRYGNLTAQLKSKLARHIQTAMKIIGTKENNRIFAQGGTEDSERPNTHILNPEF